MITKICLELGIALQIGAIVSNEIELDVFCS